MLKHRPEENTARSLTEMEVYCLLLFPHPWDYRHKHRFFHGCWDVNLDLPTCSATALTHEANFPIQHTKFREQ